MCGHCHLGCSALGKPRRKMSVVEGMVTGLTVKRSPTGRAWGWLSYYDRRIKETFVASLALAQLMRVTDKVDVVLNSGSKPGRVGLASCPRHRYFKVLSGPCS